MKCLKCDKKDHKIKELKDILRKIHKNKKLTNKYLKFSVADALRSLNGYNINEARKTLKDIGSVKQYHNYPKDKGPEKPKPIWFDGKVY